MRKIIFLLAFLMPLFLYSQEIKVIYYNDPPMVYKNKLGNPAGFFIDILNDIAENENWKLEYKYYEVNEIMEGITKNQFDIIPDIINTGKDNVYFGKENVYSSWGKVYLAKHVNVLNIIDLNNKTVVIQDGDHIVDGNKFGLLKTLSSFNIQVKLITVKTYEEVFEYVSQGKADAGVVNKIFGDLNFHKYNLKKSEILFSPFSSTFGTPLANAEAYKYINTIDKYIKEYKKNPQSIYYKSQNKYLLADEEETVPAWFYTTIFLVTTVVIILIFTGFFLKHQIKRRTFELSQANLQLNKSKTEIESINDELSEINRKFSTLINNLKGIVFRAKYLRTFPMEFISNGVYELIGYQSDAFFTKENPLTWLAVVYHEDMTMVWNEIQKAVNEKKWYEINYRIINKNGNIKWVNEKGEAIFNDSGEIIAIEGFISDITLFKEKELELIKHKENLEKIVAERTREITAKNKELEQFNWELSNINEQLIVEIANRKLAQERSTKLSNELQEINVQLEERQEEIMQQAEILAVTNEELERKKSKLEEILNELKNAQSKLIQSEKMATVGQLTAGIAHEINNPVNFINAGIDSLESILNEIMLVVNEFNEITPENAIDKLQKIKLLKENLNYEKLLEGVSKLTKNIKTGAVRTTQIVKSLRLFSRLDESDIKFVDLHENIDSTLVMLQNKYKNRINIVKDYTKIAMLECFPGKINQVFMNLLVNAIDSIPDKGEIIIKTGVSEDKFEGKPKYVYISIKDTGIGMSAEVMSRIFEPFFTTKEIGKGTGLGLSISYSIIQDHNGEIEVFSQPGKGTEFFITLPVIAQIKKDNITN